MLNEKTIQQLKQTNISVDSEKTQQRLTALWRAAGKAAQAEILALAGIKRSSVQRAYRAGTVSAKLAVPFAQTLGVDPLYLTGETDEQGGCDEGQILAFLKDHKYDALLAQIEKERKKQERAAKKAAAEDQAAPSDEADACDAPAECCDAEQQALLDRLTEEDLTLLLKAVLLKAQSGEKYADIANQIKRLLLA